MNLEAHIIRAHNLLTGQTEDDHHNRGVAFKVQISGQSIPTGVTNILIDVGKTGYKLATCYARGDAQLLPADGYEGSHLVGVDETQKSQSLTIKDASGTYVYIGAFSRLHGDSYLSNYGLFGQNIRCEDFYISGSDVVFVMDNAYGSNRNVVLFATGWVK